MKSVVCILSSNFSGSHYLSLVLGSHSKAIHLGEVKNLVKQKPRPCHACGDVDACELFSEIGLVPQDQIYAELFQRAGEGVECLVDNSKKPGWFEALISQPDIDFKVIHLLRDPRALMRRWIMNYDSGKLRLRQRWRQFRYWNGKPDILFSRSMLNTYIHKWIYQNREIRDFIEAHDLDHRVVLYRELALTPADAVSPLVNWTGLEFEPGQIEYWNFTHHGTQKADYEWIKEQGKTRYIDLRWQEYLSDKDLSMIMDHRQLYEFMSGLGVVFGDDGLYWGPGSRDSAASG